MAAESAVAAVVLAGGRGSRLGGVDKAAIELAGRTLLERALGAVAGATPIVVVGPERRLPPDVIGVQEQPAGGGPVAALSAGLAALHDHVSSVAGYGGPAGESVPELVVVLACDMPFVDTIAIGRLVAAAGESSDTDGAAFVDVDGRRQHLAAAYRTANLGKALTEIGTIDGAAMRDVVRRLTMIEIRADPETTLDCDTWPDVRRTQAIVGERVEERVEEQ